MKKLFQVASFILLALPYSTFGQLENDCNILINPNRIYYGYGIDNFIKSLRNDSFDVSGDRNTIPTFISKKLHCLIGDIASLNEDWAAGCTNYQDLPERQIQFHGINHSKNTFILVYKKGGIGVSTIIIMMRLTDKGIIIDEQKNVEDFWCGHTLYFEDHMDIKDLPSFLTEHRYFERLNSVDFKKYGLMF